MKITWHCLQFLQASRQTHPTGALPLDPAGPQTLAYEKELRQGPYGG